LITNDFIWWVPFAMILWGAAKAAHAPEGDAEPLEAVLHSTETSDGVTLAERSRQGTVLLALVRHAGCTFCKEALADLGEARERIENTGVRPVVVHMGEPGSLDRLMARHGLEGVETVADPDRRLYRALELPRGSFSQLFGLRVWVRGFIATMRGHLVGRLKGDGFQMPGTVVLRDGVVVARHDHETAADRADFRGPRLRGRPHRRPRGGPPGDGMTEALPLILALHAAATLMMTGLVWFVHAVHYPMFADAAEAGDEHWTAVPAQHLRRTTPLIPPIMLLEIATAALLLVDPTGSTARAWAWAGAGLLAVVWASTFLGAVPMHAKLERGFAPGPAPLAPAVRPGPRARVDGAVVLRAADADAGDP
jgi:peroxiredoxin